MQIDTEVEFISRAGHVDQVAEVADDALAVAREKPGGLPRFPSAARSEPSRRGEMMQRHDRLESVFPAGREHSPVVFKLGERKLALCGFDPSPFDGESIGVETEPGEER